jgi:hypothetical protein
MAPSESYMIAFDRWQLSGSSRQKCSSASREAWGFTPTGAFALAVPTYDTNVLAISHHYMSEWMMASTFLSAQLGFAIQLAWEYSTQ